MTEHYEWIAKQVLVTGGAGFIGSHLVEKLSNEGARVTIIDNMSAVGGVNFQYKNDQVKLINTDILKVSWKRMLSEMPYDVIFHLAGPSYVPFSVDYPALDYKLNLDITFQLLETLRAMRWPGKLIYPSSGAVYGNPGRMPIHEDDPTVPISPYGVSKLGVERYIQVYSKLYGIHAASLRIFSVYGPRQRKLLVYDLIRKIFDNPREVFLYGDGDQLRDFIYVEDAARAMMLTAEKGELNGEVYNLASGIEYSIQEIVKILCQVLNVAPKVVYSGAVRPGEPEKWVVDITYLKNLGFNYQVELYEGLTRTIKWYESTLTK